MLKYKRTLLLAAIGFVGVLGVAGQLSQRWATSVGIISGAGLYLLGAVTCLMVTVVLVLLHFMESPVTLSLMMVQCQDLQTGYRVMQLVKDHTNFCRLKNKTVQKSGTELIIEIKTKNLEELDAILLQTEGVENYSFMSYDRENRIS